MRRSRFSLRLWLPVLLALTAVGWMTWLVGDARVDDDAGAPIDQGVVRIFVTGPNGASTGTGLVVDNEGHVATNYHVVRAHLERSWPLTIGEPGTGEPDRLTAQVVAAYPGEDLAILHAEGLSSLPVTFAATSDGALAKGAEVYAVGYPGAADRLGPVDDASLVPGIVSRIFTSSWSASAPAIGIIQHTAPTNPGNSGGPLVDRCGHVIGVNSQREVRMVFGPGGVPLVTDPIQGVFYASNAIALTEKLSALGLGFAMASGMCTPGATRPPNVVVYGALPAVFFLLAATSWAIVMRPKTGIRVLVDCGAFVGDCAMVVARAARQLQADQRDPDQVDIVMIPDSRSDEKPGRYL